MAEVYDASGTLIGNLPVSELLSQMLDRGATATIRFRTPQTMRSAIADRQGEVALSVGADGKITTVNVTAAKELLAMLAESGQG
jgi:hypothetical protein